MSINLSGLVSLTGMTYPIQTALHFTNKRKLTSDSVLMGLAGPVATLPTKFAGKKKGFSFILTGAPGATLAGNPFTGTLSYTLKFSGKSISIIGSGELFGDPTEIFISARRR